MPRFQDNSATPTVFDMKQIYNWDANFTLRNYTAAFLNLLLGVRNYFERVTLVFAPHVLCLVSGCGAGGTTTESTIKPVNVDLLFRIDLDGQARN